MIAVSGEPGADREIIADRFTEAGLEADRFIECEAGGKASHDHDTRHDSPPDGNYGIYATPADEVVLIDVDQYEDGAEPDGLLALTKLPQTLTQESPHGGEHHILRVEPSDDGLLVAPMLKDTFGKQNPNPSWGEVRAANQYIVGAGSQLDGCGKDWCDECDDPEGGYYTVEGDHPIATVSAEKLVEVLEADPEIERENDEDDTDDHEDTEASTEELPDSGDIDVDDRLEHALENDDKLRRLFNGRAYSDYDDDRSAAESALAAKLGWWFEGDKAIVRDLMNKANADKWAERPDDSYRESVLEAVDELTDTYDPDHNRSDQRGGQPATADDSAGVAPADPEPPEPEELLEDHELDAAEDDADDTGDEPDSAETDGGAASIRSPTEVTLGPAGDTVDTSTRLDPSMVKGYAELDEDDRVGDLPQRERAYYAWQVLKQKGVNLISVEPDNELYICRDGIWHEEGENALRRYLGRALGPAYSTGVLKEAKDLVIRDPPFVRREHLGAPEQMVPVANGMLDLEKARRGREDALRPLKPDDYALNRLTPEYDPDAECPRFMQYLDEDVRDEDVLKLQEYLGYMLHHWGQPFKKALLLIGPTDSGKSTFTRLVREFLGGEDNVASETLYDLISTRWGTAELFGQMANIRNELSSNELKRPERFKELTGGEEQISAEKKGSDKFSFVVKSKFLFSTNEVPSIEGADPAFYNRWLFASFPHTLDEDEKDPDLIDDLIDELPGILNWALEGYDRLLKQDGFSNERTLDEKQSMWEEHGGTIARFKAEMLHPTGRRSDDVKKSDVYALYTAYCDYIAKEAETQQKLTSELKKDDRIGDKEQGGDRYFTGVQIDQRTIGGRAPLDDDTFDDDDHDPANQQRL